MRAARVLQCLGALTVAYAAGWPYLESASAAPAPRARLALTRLRFEPNAGQLADDVRLLARGQGFGLYLTEGGATLALQGDRAMARQQIELRLVGAAPTEPRPSDELAGRNHYFVGADQRRWKSDVPSYARASYRNALPGVSLTFYGTEAGELV
jgi:hypothetical protein